MPSSDRILTKEEFDACTGSEECHAEYGAVPIYLGAGNKVFDIPFGGITFYGPGCSNNRFA